MAESVGTFDLLWIAPTTTYSALEFADGTSLGLTEQFIDPNGMRGTRQHDSRRVRRGTRQTGGNLRFQPTPVELDLLLPWVMGTAKSGNNFALAETVPTRNVKTSRDGTVHLYDGVKVDAATFSASEGSLLGLDLSVIGVDEAASTAPSGPPAIDDTQQPFVMMDCALTVGGTSYAFRSMQVSVSNGLEVRYNNSATPSSIHATDLNVSVQLGLPYGDASALYGSALAGVAVVATFTNGAVSLTLTLNDVAAPRQPLELGGRRARTLNWQGVARRDGSAAAFTIDVDSTP